MAHFVAAGNGLSTAGKILCSNPTKHHTFTLIRPREIVVPVSNRRHLHFKVSAKKLSPAGRFDGKNRRSSTKTKDQEDEGNYNEKGANGVERNAGTEGFSASTSIGVEGVAGDGYFLPDLPGNEPDFWEGSKWDVFGFVMQYLWAFGVVFAVFSSPFSIVCPSFY